LQQRTICINHSQNAKLVNPGCISGYNLFVAEPPEPQGKKLHESIPSGFKKNDILFSGARNARKGSNVSWVKSDDTSCQRTALITTRTPEARAFKAMITKHDQISTYSINYCLL
jgi:hypothetical protein